MNNKKAAVIFDLDGTLADRRHRLHFIEQSKDWKGFFEQMINDPPIKEVVAKLLDHHELQHAIIILTGRPDEYREHTINWLSENKILPHMYKLIMRESKNYESDVSLKRRFYENKLNSYNVIKVYEDQRKLIDMWESKGLKVENCSLD